MDVCEGWTVSAVAATGDGPVTVEAPALIMRGWLDPFSAPLADVAAAIGAADNVSVLEVLNQSDNVLGYVECPRKIRNAWIDVPELPPGHHVPRPDPGNRARTLTAGQGRRGRGLATAPAREAGADRARPGRARPGRRPRHLRRCAGSAGPPRTSGRSAPPSASRRRRRLRPARAIRAHVACEAFGGGGCPAALTQSGTRGKAFVPSGPVAWPTDKISARTCPRDSRVTSHHRAVP